MIKAIRYRRKQFKKGYLNGYRGGVKAQKKWYEIQLRVLQSGHKASLKGQVKSHQEELAMLKKEHKRKEASNEARLKKELKKAQTNAQEYERLKQKWADKVSYLEHLIHELELMDRSKANMVTEILTRAALLNKRDIKLDQLRDKYNEHIAGTVDDMPLLQ